MIRKSLPVVGMTYILLMVTAYAQDIQWQLMTVLRTTGL